MILFGKNKITSENTPENLHHWQHLHWLINSGLNLLLSGKSEALASRHPPAIRLNVPGILTFYWFQSKGYAKKAARSPKGILATNTLGEIQTTANRKKDKMQIWVTNLKQLQRHWGTFKVKPTCGPGIRFWLLLSLGNTNSLRIERPPLPMRGYPPPKWNYLLEGGPLVEQASPSRWVF